MTNEAEQLGDDFSEQLHRLAPTKPMPAGGERILPRGRYFPVNAAAGR